jgi:5-methylcytosine-specific restriction protein A
LQQIVAVAQRQGKQHTDVASGDLHRSVGGYPKRNHRMPTCCAVMRQAMRQGDRVLAEPASGRGARLIIRFQLPRQSD